MTDQTDPLLVPPEMPAPFDYSYEWDGAFGTTRAFSSAPHNGRKPDRGVPVFREDQLTARDAIWIERLRSVMPRGEPVACANCTDAEQCAAYSRGIQAARRASQTAEHEAMGKAEPVACPSPRACEYEGCRGKCAPPRPTIPPQIAEDVRVLRDGGDWFSVKGRERIRRLVDFVASLGDEHDATLRSLRGDKESSALPCHRDDASEAITDCHKHRDVYLTKDWKGDER